MTLEELTKALGLDTDENKDKAGILKKESNAKLKDINEKTKEIESFKEAEKVAKQNADRLEIVTKAYNLDFNAKDVDAMIEESKDKLIKAAGVNDKNSEEFKATKNELTKARREITRIKEENSQLSEQLTAEKNQRINTTKRNMIHKALVNNNAIKPDMFVDMFVDKVKIGKLNYYQSDIDWGKFGRKAESLCKHLGIDYYIKYSLRKEMIGNNAEEKE